MYASVYIYHLSKQGMMLQILLQHSCCHSIGANLCKFDYSIGNMFSQLLDFADGTMPRVSLQMKHTSSSVMTHEKVEHALPHILASLTPQRPWMQWLGIA